MAEQQAATEIQASKCPHPEAVGKRWGDPVSEERQAELETWIADHQDWMNQPPDSRDIPCSQLRLTGADIFWFSRRARKEYANCLEAVLAGEQPLDSLREESWNSASSALVLHLEAANLLGAHLEGADLSLARLDDAVLDGAHLEGANLSEIHLEGTDLTGATLDEDTILSGAFLGPGAFRDWLDQLRFRNKNAAVSDIKWHGATLAYVRWEQMRRIGDEQVAGPSLAAVAYRQVAIQLRAQGISEVADRFAYRSQICQRRADLRDLRNDWRRPWRLPGDFARYVGSLFLAGLAGYGYRPGRTLFWYVVTVLSFMYGYLLVTHGVPLFTLTEPASTQPLHWYEALVLSLASFHGRGFFPQGINLGDPVAILAACEAVIGLFVEISFIATFTQRYFGGK